jgi:hypothetical protein
MMKRLEAAANKVRDSLIKNIGHYSTEKPIVKELDGTWKVIWEAGPFEWTMNDGYGLYEELVPFMEETGGAEPYEEEKFYDVPKGYEAEADNGCVLSIYAA